MNQLVEQRSIEESTKVASTDTQMLKLICIKILDPKNVQNLGEYTILRVPMYSLGGIKANYPDRVKFTTKGAYKHFVNDVRKQNHGGTATSIGASAKEIRYASVIKKEAISGTFPAYKEGNPTVMLSDLKEADRNEKIAKGIHNISNNRRLTKSRKRTPKGVYIPTGMPIGIVSGYDIIAKTYADAGKAMPLDYIAAREHTESRKAKI